MRNSHTHVVYGYAALPISGEPIAKGWGKSDQRALADAKRTGGDGLFYFYIRSNGKFVPVSSFQNELADKVGVR